MINISFLVASTFSSAYALSFSEKQLLLFYHDIIIIKMSNKLLSLLSSLSSKVD